MSHWPCSAPVSNKAYASPRNASVPSILYALKSLAHTFVHFSNIVCLAFVDTLLLQRMMLLFGLKSFSDIT